MLQSLKQMASLGMNVACVIHQPRWSIFRLFDDVLLLGNSGRCVCVGGGGGGRVLWPASERVVQSALAACTMHVLPGTILSHGAGAPCRKHGAYIPRHLLNLFQSSPAQTCTSPPPGTISCLVPASCRLQAGTVLFNPPARMVYLGPSHLALPYFESLGFALPPLENPADFCLDLISGRWVAVWGGGCWLGVPDSCFWGCWAAAPGGAEQSFCLCTGCRPDASALMQHCQTAHALAFLDSAEHHMFGLLWTLIPILPAPVRAPAACPAAAARPSSPTT